MSFMVMIIRVELKFGQDNGGGGDGDGNGENLGQHNLDKGIFLLVYLSSSSLSAGESRFSEKKKLEKLNSLDDDMIDV